MAPASDPDPAPTSGPRTEHFVHQETVRWQDADLQGVLNNAVYLSLFEQARLGYFGSLGLMRGDAFPFLLGETTVRFLTPIGPGATLSISARVTRLGGKSFDMDYVVRENGDVRARGTATLVWIDGDLRSTPIPDEARRAIASREGIATHGSREGPE